MGSFAFTFMAAGCRESIEIGARESHWNFAGFREQAVLRGWFEMRSGASWLKIRIWAMRVGETWDCRASAP